MKEFIEKLIGRLEEHKTKAFVTGITNRPYEFGACQAMDDAVKIVNQLAEEYKGEELRKSQKIYSFIKREINPYGKPFEGTVYEFGLKVMKYITNLHTEEYNNGFCEWKSEKDMFIQNPHNGRMFSNEPSMKNIYCNTCGKKIKIVPYQPKGE